MFLPFWNASSFAVFKAVWIYLQHDTIQEPAHHDRGNTMRKERTEGEGTNINLNFEHICILNSFVIEWNNSRYLFTLPCWDVL